MDLYEPFTYNLKVYQGATFRRTFTWRAGDPLEPVDLTGVTARMHIRRTESSSTVLVELTTENGRISIDPLNGKLTLYMSAITTDSLTVPTATYDLELIWPNSDVTRFMQGDVEIDLNVTR